MANSNIMPNLSLGVNSPYTADEQKFRYFTDAFVDTVTPVEVVAVNGAFVDVKPLLQRVTINNEIIAITDADVINNVPVLKFYGNKCKLYYELSAGVKGLLLASKFDMRNYKKVHGVCEVASARQFSFASGFFLPVDFGDNDKTGFVIENGDTYLQILPDAVNIKATTINVDCATANVNASAINLGGDGGAQVARLGDTVQVEVTSGSSAGTWNGTITSGSTIVKAK
jgi:hypothetical protein